jgi:tetratricopeptide (TPR) repeat protein
MGWLGRLFGSDKALVVRDGMCVFRRREVAQYVKRPEAPNNGDNAPQVCDCGKTMPELLITTGGPHGHPEVWRDAPIAVDGWGCLDCFVFRVPRRMTVEEIMGFVEKGAEHGRAGRFADAEWWFTRVTWDWPGYVPAHGNLAEATRERLRLQPDLDEPVRRRLRERVREQYQAAIAGYHAHPHESLITAMVRAHLSLAEMAIEDRAFELAERTLRECLALPAIADDDDANARKALKWVTERYDLFEAAAKVLDPYLDLMDRAGRRIETPEERVQVVRALEDMERHYQLDPANWRAAWFLAKGRAAVDGVEAALAVWRRARTAHPAEIDIARETSLALLRTENAAEAVVIDRAITGLHPADATLWCNLAVTELLNGNLAEARRVLSESRRLDPSDRIAQNLERRLAEYESGRPLPRNLRELERRP